MRSDCMVDLQRLLTSGMAFVTNLNVRTLIGGWLVIIFIEKEKEKKEEEMMFATILSITVLYVNFKLYGFFIQVNL